MPPPSGRTPRAAAPDTKPGQTPAIWQATKQRGATSPAPPPYRRAAAEDSVAFRTTNSSFARAGSCALCDGMVIASLDLGQRFIEQRQCFVRFRFSQNERRVDAHARGVGHGHEPATQRGVEQLTALG